MSDILLLQPPLPPPLDAYVRDMVLTPPLGLCYLASCLKKDYRVSILDASILNLDMKTITSEIKKADPKILGITTTTYTYKNSLKIAQIAKQLNKSIATVLGGPHVTFTAEETLSNHQIDFVVRHEGEMTMKQLSDFILKKEGKLGSIKGVTYRAGEEIISASPQPLIEDLDGLPFPSRDLTPLHLYRIPGSIITSRGCPSKCIFCAAGAMSGQKYRVRSPDNIVKEVQEMIQKINPGFFFIADDTFTIFPERVKAISQKFRELGIRWVCEARVNTVNEEILEELASAGCFAIQFGVESGSQKILDSILKGTTIKQVRNAVNWCLKLGIIPVCSFMTPHPEDDWETVMETEKLMNELRGLGAQLYVSLTTPFPGTFLYDKATELGIKLLTEDTDDYNLATPVIQTKNFSVEDVDKIFDRFMQISKDTIPFENM
ncbi:B12-binding domain-containing radical SAM protein [[Eubacterium] cellulosolvens]